MDGSVRKMLELSRLETGVQALRREEFPLAARLVESGRLDLSPLITASYPLEKAEEAILAASDKTRSMKVVLTGPAL